MKNYINKDNLIMDPLYKVLLERQPLDIINDANAFKRLIDLTKNDPDLYVRLLDSTAVSTISYNEDRDMFIDMKACISLEILDSLKDSFDYESAVCFLLRYDNLHMLKCLDEIMNKLAKENLLTDKVLDSIIMMFDRYEEGSSSLDSNLKNKNKKILMDRIFDLISPENISKPITYSEEKNRYEEYALKYAADPNSFSYTPTYAMIDEILKENLPRLIGIIAAISSRSDKRYLERLFTNLFKKKKYKLYNQKFILSLLGDLSFHYLKSSYTKKIQSKVLYALLDLFKDSPNNSENTSDYFLEINCARQFVNPKARMIYHLVEIDKTRKIVPEIEIFKGALQRKEKIKLCKRLIKEGHPEVGILDPKFYGVFLNYLLSFSSIAETYSKIDKYDLYCAGVLQRYSSSTALFEMLNESTPFSVSIKNLAKLHVIFSGVKETPIASDKRINSKEYQESLLKIIKEEPLDYLIKRKVLLNLVNAEKIDENILIEILEELNDNDAKYFIENSEINYNSLSDTAKLFITQKY